ncbi:MAG: GNAT family N-acetyltransferase [Caldilineaceae bacterium]
MARTVLRPFAEDDLPTLIAFWNEAFADQPNFYPIHEDAFRQRVLASPLVDAAGLILAWREDDADLHQLVGLVHALQPPPKTGVHANWPAHHTIAVLYVTPSMRGQGIGSRLLQAAESWLYYCPVHFAGHAQAVYGTVEGPHQPFFGSTERMGIQATESTLIDFLAKRGYLSVEIGDVTLARSAEPPAQPSFPAGLNADGFRPIRFSHLAPFTGKEATRMPSVSLWGDNGGDPYFGIGVVDADNVLRGQIAWYPMHTPKTMALVNFRLDPELRGHRAGSFLLDMGLNEMMQGVDRGGRAIETVTLHTHLTLFPDAMRLYRSRGFEVTDAWVNLVKT